MFRASFVAALLAATSLSGCALFDRSPIGQRNMIFIDPQRSMIEIRDGEGEATAEDVSFRVFTNGNPADHPRRGQIDAYSIAYFDRDGKRLSELDQPRMSLESPVSIPSEASFTLPVLHPALKAYGSMQVKSGNAYTIMASITLYAQMLNGQEGESSGSMVLRFLP